MVFCLRNKKKTNKNYSLSNRKKKGDGESIFNENKLKTTNESIMLLKDEPKTLGFMSFTLISLVIMNCQFLFPDDINIVTELSWGVIEILVP